MNTLKHASLLILLVSSTYSLALSMADRRARIELALRASTLSPEQKVTHALNRLGYGADSSTLGLGLNDFLKYKVNSNGTKVLDQVATDRALALWVAQNLQAINRVESSSEQTLASFRETLQTPVGRFTVYPNMTSQQMRDVYFPIMQYLDSADLPEQARNEANAARTKIINISKSGEAPVAFTRAVMAKYPLGEALHNFWTNHFNVTAAKVYIHMGLFQEYRSGLRSRQQGLFSTLLSYTAHHPAMLLYLDNYKNMRPISATRGINENYAREILELHTFGEGPNLGTYTQGDVYQAARVLTGLTIRGQQPGSSPYSLFCIPCHDPGSKRLLGLEFAEGEAGQAAFLNHIANHPRTARNISQKLVTRFVSEPGVGSAEARAKREALVDRMTAKYLETSGHLFSVYDELFTSIEFWSADAFQSKVKQPFEWTVSAYRAAGIGGPAAPLTKTLADAGVWQIRQLGQPIHDYAFPTGYKDASAHWANTSVLTSAFRLGLELAQQHRNGFWTRLKAFVTGDELENYFTLVRRNPADSSYVNEYGRRTHASPCFGAVYDGPCDFSEYLPEDQIRRNAEAAIGRDVFDFEAIRPSSTSPSAIVLQSALLERADRKGARIQPVRTHLGLMLASPGFLRK